MSEIKILQDAFSDRGRRRGSIISYWNATKKYAGENTGSNRQRKM